MKFETVRIYFLSDILVCCHSKILLPWQRDVTTSLLYFCVLYVFFVFNTQFYNRDKSAQIFCVLNPCI